MERPDKVRHGRGVTVDVRRLDADLDGGMSEARVKRTMSVAD